MCEMLYNIMECSKEECGGIVCRIALPEGEKIPNQCFVPGMTPDFKTLDVVNTEKHYLWDRVDGSELKYGGE